MIEKCEENKYLSMILQLDEETRLGARAPEKKTSSSKKDNKEPDFASFKTGITGFARIIRYTIDDDKNHLSSIEEGQYVKGLKQGYCRVIHASIGACEIGYFHEDQARGKYCAYALDGTFIKQEGLYKGEAC